MLLRIAPILVVLVSSMLPARENAHAADDPASFIADLGQRAVKILTSKISDADREAQFGVLFDEGFDVLAISRFVLGPHWRTASDAQRQEFVKLFRTYVVHAYSVRFSQYSGQQLKVLGSTPDGSNVALVRSQIVESAGAPPLKVEWRVAKTDKGFRIIDVIVDNISMAMTHRQEFAAVIQRNGGQLDPLLKLLRERAGQA